MYKIENELLSYTINDEGLAASIVNKLTAYELITHPMPIWKLIYSEGETMEHPVFGSVSPSPVTSIMMCLVVPI